MLMLALILIAGFKTCNGTKPNALTKSSTTMNKSITSTRRWRKGPPSLRASGRYSIPAVSPVTFKAARCMRSCRSINQKQLLSWGQSCSRASRTRTNSASSGSSSRNSLRALTASRTQVSRVEQKRQSAGRAGSTGKSSLTISAKPVGVGAACQLSTRTGEQSGLLTRIGTTESVSLCTRMKS